MIGRAMTGALLGVDSIPVRVEVDVGRGLPNFTIVGLPDAAVQESRERVRSALVNCGFEFPMCRLTANLAPADVRKEGPVSDLALALAILAATGQIPSERLATASCFGELSLGGEVRPVSGMLCHAIGASAAGMTDLLVPAANAVEASLVGAAAVRPVRSLEEAVRHVRGEESVPPAAVDKALLFARAGRQEEDLADVRGQAHAKRALEIAAAGGHNVLMIGPPGSGKTMLARRLAGILPPMTFEEALEVTKLHSVAGPPARSMAGFGIRPFRAPHHTVSVAGLVGGGNPLRPGEVSLAHNGVLFLDEIAEFGKACLQVLRQPMEDASVTISRAAHTLTFPARFMLVAAMNPCPCGHLGDPRRECTCSMTEIHRYRGRLSGPLLDRIDLCVEVRRLSATELAGIAPAEPSAVCGARVVAARARQAERFKGSAAVANAHMRTRQLRKHCALDAESARFMALAADRLALSGRGYDRVLRVARTIADLRGCPRIEARDVAEAIQYRGTEVMR